MKVKDQGEQRNEKLPRSTFTSGLHLTLKAGPVIALATIGLCVFTQTVAKEFGIDLPEQTNVELVRRAVGWNWGFMRILALVLVAAPLIEELIFRGLLFKVPCRLIKTATLAFALISSALFSAAHYIQAPFPDNAFLALFFFGLAQCWLYRKTGRLWCSILNHSLFNLTNLVLLFAVPK